MTRFVSNKRIADELVKRGLVPAHCRVLEIAISIEGAFTIRYERFVEASELADFADALKAVAVEGA